MPNSIPRKLCLASLAVILAVALAWPCTAPATAWADETSTELPNIAELQEKVEAASAVYDDANRRIADIEAQMVQTGDRILDISKQMPSAKKKSNQAAADYYRLVSTSNMFLDLFFGATSMSEFFANLEYTIRINQSYLDKINLLSDLTTELETAQANLEADKKTIEEERRKAEEALQDAQYARDVAEETARRIAEETAAATAAAAAAAAEAAANQGAPTPLPPTTGNGGSGGDGGGGAPPGDNQSSDKQTFVNQWAGRIDAYLSGSPMAGTGWIFANAAYDYNVDPRWSPAIACLESSKGRYCFRDHNAWGWGQVDWPDWETAIYGHVGGLSRGYGYTITIDAAYKYCPPNAEYWYSFVSGQMNLI